MTTRKDQKSATREKLLEAAARRMKRDGIKATSVKAVMADANLTHGSFYAYFDDKNGLVTEALRWSVDISHKRVEAQLPATMPAEDRLRAFLRFYLSAQHRGMAADGCPITTLARDFAHAPQALRHEFAAGLLATIDKRRRLFSGAEKTFSRNEWIGVMSCYIGALLLSRACEGEPLSDQILEAALSYIDTNLSPEKAL